MAEAFGLAAGVLQVAGFGAEVSSTLFKCAKKIHNASEELEEIASQVGTTSISLRRVDALLKDPTTKALRTQKLYDDTNTVSKGCSEVFHELDNYVKSFDSKPGFGKMAFRSKVRWSFDSSKVHGLGSVLRRYSDVLHLMISVMAIVEGHRAATRDGLQALEADLKLLALSNKDLSQSNKTLTDTIAAISRAPISPVARKPISPPVMWPVTDGQGTSRAMPVTMLFATPPAKLPPAVPRKQSPSNKMSDHLQRCMKSVQELAMTISCALDTLQGREKIGSSDVHGSYEKLSLAMAQLPTHVQCDQCKQSVAWSHFKPARSGIECKCIGQIPPPPREPCSSPMDSRAPKSGYYAEERKAESEKISIQHSQSHEIDKATQSVVGHYVDPIVSASPEAQAYQKAPTRYASSLLTAPLSFGDLRVADHQHHGLVQQHQLSPRNPDKNRADSPEAHESLSPSTRYRYPRHPMMIPEIHQGTAPLAPPPRPAQDGGDDDYPSTGNKPTHVPSESGPFQYAYGSDPTFTPDRSRLPGPILSEIDISMMALPSGMQQSQPRHGSRKKSPHLGQEAKDRSSKMHKLSTVRKRGPKSFESHQGRHMRDYYHDLDGNQQRHQEQNKERDPTPEYLEHLGSVGGGSPDGESLDLDLDIAYSAPDPQLIRWKNPNGPGDTTHEATNPPVHVGSGIESLRNPFPSSSIYRQHVYASTPNYQASQDWPTQRPVSPGAHQATLADLERQNKKRLLEAREDDEDFAHYGAAPSPDSGESIGRRRSMRSCLSDQEEDDIKAAVEKMRQPPPPEPDQPATSTPLKPQGDSGRFLEEGVCFTFADASAGGGGLDNFDFYNFFEADDGGIDFSFPDFDEGLEDDVAGTAQDGTSQIEMNTENAPRHKLKRSHSDAFPESPEHTPMSQYRKRRAASLSPRTGEACESSGETVEAIELPTDSTSNEVSADGLLGVEALLQRWFDASATAVLLPSDS